MFFVTVCAGSRRIANVIPRHRFCSILRHHKASSMVNMEKPVEESICRKLRDGLNPVHLEVTNESYMHNVPKGSETHFKVYVVSEMFDNLTLIKRHQLVHQLLAEELKKSLHALSIQAKTPEQHEQCSGDKKATKSPACRGGFGH